jgi:hypothetical protein
MQGINSNKEDIIRGTKTERNEAVTYLKEILTECGDLIPEILSFETSDNDLAKGLQVRIKGRIQEAEMQIVKQVAEKHSYEVQENADGIIIYKPL